MRLPLRLRHLLLTQLFLLPALAFSSCSQNSSEPVEKWVVGLVSYDTGAQSLDKYQNFKEYLGKQTHKIIELEPALNELQAVQQINNKTWSVVFAPPGLAAIAIGKNQYTPIFPLQGLKNLRSVLLVRDDSPVSTIADLANKVVALGQPGSASGYYLPLYDLYGLTLKEIRFSPTPATILEWLSKGTIDAGALSEEEFQQHRNQFGTTKFRVLHTSRPVPAGVVLVSPTVDANAQEQIKKAMNEATGSIVEDAGYIPNVKVPDYSQFVKLVEKVRPLDAQVKKKPAVLEFNQTSAATPQPQ
ncbi:phosphate/phosphite/phosphonate ABC transporter substrate-binding protein [Stenomitos frigidus]|uniref:Phosphonate ABC transporter substrate-binding protein n=1 Tax=Stenomitos frigidus ULC18 TaxID=2107698 RepID=A0A2T1ECP1_9CYAN|nr:phosphate/phosphite/phosphonate ABC transporter substrate-binding protein [Stenomitos frigidus]PSB30522.1 phosphonate ABC transporter substrate-binding protein [Stenomitos frigidus ULC18]